MKKRKRAGAKSCRRKSCRALCWLYENPGLEQWIRKLERGWREMEECFNRK